MRSIIFGSKLNILYKLHFGDILSLMLMRFRTSPNLPVNNLEGNSQAYPTLGCYLIIIIIIIINIIMCNIHIIDSAYYV